MGLFYLTHHGKSMRTSLNLLYSFFTCQILTDMNKQKEHASFSAMNMYFCIIYAKYVYVSIRLGTAQYIIKTDWLRLCGSHSPEGVM